jgi:hypothetical protein
MSELVFLTHIPLLRIEQDSIPFMVGDLWRMPFEAFNDLTVGAFEDHQQRYDAAAPVFYRAEADLPLPMLHPPNAVSDGKRHRLELKMATDNWQLLNSLGLGFMLWFQDTFVDPAWSALLLAAPATTLPQPRNSVSFAVSTTEDMFHLGEAISSTLRVQGDADIEFVLLAEGTCSPLSADIIEKTAQLKSVLDRVKQVPELHAALRALQFATAPALYPAEQLTLTVVALESLLLPEVKSGLGATFSRRLSHLLSAEPAHREHLRAIAALLYDVRSAGLHGGAPRSPEEADVAIRDAFGSQLLASAIIAIGANSEPLDAVRTSLDTDGPPLVMSDATIPTVQPPGKRSYERLLRASTEETFGVSFGSNATASLAAEEGMLLSWSPLVGLGIEKEFPLGEQGSPLVLGLTGPEVLTLEDKDLRRDFLAQLTVVQNSVATLAIAAPVETAFSQGNRSPRELLRQRDLSVVALRLAGFQQFHDPELLGTFVFEGTMRYRRGTVLRQTILQQLRVTPEQHISPPDRARTGPLWAMLSQYDREVRHPDVDNVLVLIRRAFYHGFLPPAARAGLMFSALESMLGRSRPFKEKVQIHNLISYIAGADTQHALWFAQHGREFRNSIAHGQWDPDSDDPQPLAHMASILQALVPAYVRFWLEFGAGSPDRPGRAFIQQVTSRVTDGGI